MTAFVSRGTIGTWTLQVQGGRGQESVVLAVSRCRQVQDSRPKSGLGLRGSVVSVGARARSQGRPGFQSGRPRQSGESGPKCGESGPKSGPSGSRGWAIQNKTLSGIARRQQQRIGSMKGGFKSLKGGLKGFKGFKGLKEASRKA